jgi:hypothetical protein
MKETLQIVIIYLLNDELGGHMSVNFGIFYKKRGSEELFEYTNNNYAGDQDDKKST